MPRPAPNRPSSPAAQPHPLVGREVEATIERIVPGGAGLAHAKGLTLFVPLAAPGDRLRVRVERVQGRTAFGEIVAVLEPGPGRATPPCPYFGTCGGCDFQQLAYPAQLAANAAILADCLRRIAGLNPPADLQIIPSPEALGYRLRAEWHVDPSGPRVGYLARRSHAIVDVATCPILVPALNRALADVRRRVAAGAWPPATLVARAVAGEDGAVALAPAAPGDPVEVKRVVAGERYRFGPNEFFQTNAHLLPTLVEEALRFAPPPGAGAPGPALDLFCGVGLFTLPLARRFAAVVGVEADRGAATAARRNLAAAGLGNARIEIGRVDQWLRRHSKGHSEAPFVLVDPPRAGLDPGTLAALLALRPAQLSYVSCDPATLARDLKTLLAAGYRLASLIGLDLFPQSHHLETVAHLALGAG